MKEHYDVIIVGTGAAGLYCALNLPEKMKILLITKQEADQSDSFLAQGGICMLRGEDDYENYFEDTMRAGHYENNKRAVDLMIRSSNDIIRDLLRYHVDFARDGLGNLAFTREGAHSQPRILFHEDITGKEITQTLLTAAKIKENIEICEYMTMVDLISKDNTVCGIIAMDRNDQAFPVYSQYVVLACGGIGGLFKNSTNFSHIAGRRRAGFGRGGFPLRGAEGRGGPLDRLRFQRRQDAHGEGCLRSRAGQIRVRFPSKIPDFHRGKPLQL